MMRGSERPPVRAGMATDRGQVRQQNEDACFVAAERGLFILSDGMGGHRGGAIASRMVVDALPRLLQGALDGQLSNEERRQVLSRAAVELSARLRRDSLHEAELRGMGATLVLAVV